MGLKKILTGALGGLALSLASCTTYFPEAKSSNPIPIEQKRIQTAKILPAEPREMKKGEYSVNLACGFALHILAHEGAHALTGLAYGIKIEEFHPYPGIINGEFHGGWVTFEAEGWHNASSRERALISAAGPLADIALTETINYYLRNGHIEPEHQPLWATASLMARGGPLWIAISALTDSATLNDLRSIERETGIPEKNLAGLIGLHALLNGKRIAKEVRVALGKDLYDYKKGQKGRFFLMPDRDNKLDLLYCLKF